MWGGGGGEARTSEEAGEGKLKKELERRHEAETAKKNVEMK